MPPGGPGARLFRQGLAGTGWAGGASGGGNIYLTVQVEAHPGTDGAAVGQSAGAAIIRQLVDVLGLLNQGPAPAPG